MKKQTNKKKPIVFIHNDLWHINIWYFKKWTRPEMQSYLKKKYFFDDFNAASDDDVGGSVTVLPLFMKETDKAAHVYCLYLPTPTDIGMVAHEAFHIASRVLRERGLTLCDESEESFAYLITWICNQVVKQNP